MMELKGELLGKRVYVYDPQLNCSESHIVELLKSYSKILVLRSISELSVKVFNNTNEIYVFRDVPITDNLLQRATKYALLYANNSVHNGIPEDIFVLLLKMIYINTDKKVYNDPDELIMKIGYDQFSEQENKLYKVARIYFILSKMWEKNEKAKVIDIENAIVELSGLTFKEMILCAYMMIGNKNGYFYLTSYNDSILKILKDNNINIDEKKFKKFFEWSSIKMCQIKFDEHEINPLILTPIIDTEIKPNEETPTVSILPVYSNLFSKCTTGLYFQLCKKYDKGGKNNIFKECFGYVFEDYVGFILKKNNNTWLLQKEVVYMINKNQESKTVDWFLLKDNKAIYFEVKQSSLFLSSKIEPNNENICKDLKTTVGKAITQFKTCRNNIASLKYDELKFLAKYTDVEYVVVLNDPLYNANYIVNKVLNVEIQKLGQHIHVMNISDFEQLLYNQSKAESLFDLLKYKNMNNPEMDFKEYNIEMYPNNKSIVTHLKESYDELFEGIIPNSNNCFNLARLCHDSC